MKRKTKYDLWNGPFKKSEYYLNPGLDKEPAYDCGDLYVDYVDGEWLVLDGTDTVLYDATSKKDALRKLAEFRDLSYDSPLAKPTTSAKPKSTLNKAGVEAELRLLQNEINKHERDYTKLREDYNDAQDEIKKLKATIHTIQFISDKRLTDIAKLQKLLAIADQAIKTLEAKCSTDHVLAIRKLPPLQLKRGYKGA